MVVFDRNYFMVRIEELDKEIQRQQAIFMNAQQQIFQFNGAKQAFAQILQEMDAPEISEEGVKELAGAESIEFVPEK